MKKKVYNKPQVTAMHYAPVATLCTSDPYGGPTGDNVYEGD